jgi:uncharacterized low-complexity protein
MKEFTKTPLALAIGATFTVSLATTPVNAADFGMTDLGSGYMQVALAGEKKDGEGKCGEGKCGDKKDGEGKCGEGKCGGDKKEGDADKGKDGDASGMAGDKESEGKCGEGKCGDKKDGEGKCGEGKCGGDKSKEGDAEKEKEGDK